MRQSRIVLMTLFAFVTGVATMSWVQSAVGQPDSKPKTMVYELRTYTTNKGKLPNLHKRFRDHTTGLFKKHGIKNIGYWTPTDEKLKDNTLVYLIAHKSRAAAAKSWKAFISDPAWKKVAKESQIDGQILSERPKSQYLTPTDYSPIK
jgi:hypothetical protein